MGGKAPLIGFVAAIAAASAIWVLSLAPLLQPGAPAFISNDAQIWSGGAGAETSENFRSGATTELAAPFKPFAELLWATLLFLVSLLPLWFGRRLFVQGKGMLAAGCLFLTLVLGTAAVFQIVSHWGGATLYPPGSVNTGWLYMSARAFLLQMAIGYVALVASMGLALAGVSRADKPMGFHLAALNWAIVAGVWTLLFLGLYLAPSLGRG